MNGEAPMQDAVAAENGLLELRSTSRADTFALGRSLGEAAEPGDVFLLRGDFGAGKTVLVQGLAAGLGIATAVTSPSFVLATEHRGRLALNHLDLFRLTQIDEDLLHGVFEYLEGDGISAIEWPEKLDVPEWLVVNEVRIVHLNETERTLTLSLARPGLVRAAQRAAARFGSPETAEAS